MKTLKEEARLVAPKARTLVSGFADSGSGGRLPAELVAEQVERLALFAGVGVALWAFALLMDLVMPPRSSTQFVFSPYVTTVETSGFVVSVLMFAYVRHANHSVHTKSNVGFVFFIANALAVALLNVTTGVLPPVPAMYISWNAVVILLFSMIMWARPVPMLMASLVAASTDPLAVWLGSFSDAQVPSFYDAIVLFMPNYACAIVAIFPAQVLRGLGRRLREAQELGSYRLVELLGHGGMGDVWRAEHRLLARSAAIKLVRPEVLGAADDAETRLLLKRFEREARATSALSSPHTIQVFDFGITNEGRFYYVMELLSGRDIESLVREFGPVSADRTIFLLRQASHSLADAHARGLVHRDIKPANIYVCRMGLEFDFVKVLDFGLVKVNERGSQQQTLVTADSKTTGTPAYMAPEVILGEADVDRRADVYALGCVAYFLLTGQLVFEAENQMKMLLLHVQAQPVPPSQRTEMPIPKALDDLVMACLEKDPNKRPQNAVELFELACGCTACDAWSNEKARQWWETNLPELTGPLTLTDPGAQSSETRATASV